MKESKSRNFWSLQFSNYDFEEILYDSLENDQEKDYQYVNLSLGKRLSEDIIRLCKDKDYTLFTYFLSSLQILLYKYTGKEDFVISIPIIDERNKKTIPVRKKIIATQSVKELLIETGKNLMESYQYQDYNWEDTIDSVECENIGKAAEEIILAFDRLHNIDNVCNELRCLMNKLSIMVFQENGNISLKFILNNKILGGDNEILKGMALCYIKVMQIMVSNHEQLIKDIDIVSAEDKEFVFNNYNHTIENYEHDRLLHKLFENQVTLTPNQTAVINGNKSITYRELDQMSDKICAYLIKENIQVGDKVAVTNERRIETISNILGILKAGAAYVPIDCEYPEERKKFIMEQSESKKLLCSDTYIKEGIDKFSESIPDREVGYDSLAYIIFTSGSTGQPKGVEISHKAACNTIIDINNKWNVGTTDRILGLSSLCFDLSVYDIFGALSVGAALVQINDQRDVNDVIYTLKKHDITIWNSVPAIMEMLIHNIDKKYLNDKLRLVMMSGDWIPIDLPGEIMRYFSNCEVISLGGATEASIWSIYFPIKKIDSDWISIPYGRPLTKQKFYVLNTDLQQMPIGATGELYIGGEGVAKGYVNDPEKTNKAFLNHLELGRIYKTGDFGKLSKRGYIIFQGRKDEQVKIRGFRVELGEIEKRILCIEGLRRAVVVPIKSKQGSLHLCAYVVADQEIDADMVKQYISKYLPAYMIPSYIIRLDELPLTGNGKVNIKLLKQHDKLLEIQNASDNYVEPTTETEKMLANVWKEILGVEKVGVHDNFFILGGDSLKAIQLVSVLQKHNFKTSIHQLFDNPTIVQLNQTLCADTLNISQEIVRGDVPMTPIQNFFFSLDLKERDYFNQYMVMQFEQRLDKEKIAEIIEGLIRHHDVLRTQFDMENKHIRQYIVDMDVECFTIDEIDLRNENDFEKGYNSAISCLNRQISINDGRLIKIGLLKSTESDFLCICVHHLLIDGISWRILLEDFSTGFYCISEGKNIEFPRKTNSYQEWSNEIVNYSNSEEILQHKDYWERIISSETIDILSSHSDSYIPKKQKQSLCKEDTTNLIKKVNIAYKTTINDILLAALEMSLGYCDKKGKVLVNVEGHGREEIFDNLNVTRTVGWFTSMYPVVLDTRIDNVSSHINNVKNRLSKIPNKGVDFNIIRFQKEDRPGTMADGKNCSINYNYLGNVDVPDGEIAIYDIGLYSSENNRWPYDIDISAMIINEQFTYEITYNSACVSEDEINNIMQYYKLSLCTIINHCMEMQNELGEENNNAASYRKMEADGEHYYDRFPLTDVQMAYLLGRSDEYEMGGVSTHMYLELETNLDMKLFNLSLQKVIDRHPMMSVVINQGGYQYFTKEKLEYNMVMEDLRNASAAVINERIEQERSRMSHFIFKSDEGPLFEFKAFLLDDVKSYLFVGYDLLMADATSIMQIIMRELLDFYNNPQLKLPEIKFTFRDYVLAYQNFKNGSAEYKRDKEYWMTKLEDFPVDLVLPYRQDPKYVKKPHFSRMTATIASNKWSELKNIAQKKGITPSALLGTAYAMILGFWGNQERLAINLTVFNRYPFNNEVYDVVGDFTSIILLDAELDTKESFWDNAKRIQGSLLDALDHRHYDGVEFIRELSKTNNIGVSVAMPFVFTSMVFNNISNDLSQLGEIKWSVSQTSQVYIDNQVMEDRGNLVISWDYVDQIFDKEVIETMFNQYMMILDKLLSNTFDIELSVTQSDLRLLKNYNDTDVAIQPQLLHELFINQARKNPNFIAVAFKDKELTYKELDGKSNQLARWLIDHKVTREKCVGVIASRDINSIINIIAILKAGGVYIPIEPSFPEERRSFILQNSNSNIMLNANSYDELCAEKYSDEPLPLINELDDIAYVIYTSGSTGTPKGVIISHAAASNTILDINSRYNVNSSDRVIGLSSLCFDLSVYDIFGTFAAGATLVMIEDQRDGIDIIHQMNKHKITVWNSVPAIMDMTIKTLKNSLGVNDNEKYFWSMVKQWSIQDNILYISKKQYGEYTEFNNMIQELYFVSQKGISVKDIYKKFSHIDKDRLSEFINCLVRDQVLITSIMDLKDIYESQDHLLQHGYGDRLLFDSVLYENFKYKQLERYNVNISKEGYKELQCYELPEEIAKRRSYRMFEEGRKITYNTFSAIFSSFRQIKDGNEIRYQYACAGGLYPIDIYVYIKADRVNDMDRGLYFYNPIYNTLEVVNKTQEILDDAHFFTNKGIFNSSAFSVYFIYNAEVTMPRYGGMGYYYAGIDTGIMVGLMTYVSELFGIGVCSIGEIDFNRIRTYFKLSKNQVLLHTIECGLKNDVPECEVSDKKLTLNERKNVLRPEAANEHGHMEDSLRLVILSGDWIPVRLPDEIKLYFSNADVISMGGATEASIWSIYYPITDVKKEWNSIPYGYPLSNQKIYILNKQLTQCPVDVKGEIYIGGVGIAKGYQGNEEKTKEAFIEHEEYGILYRTGDYGLMNKAGYVVFLGRIDFQVKIRGYRIELEEIENCLIEENGVDNIIVTIIIEQTGDQALCAYYTGEIIENERLITRAHGKLPKYMIPKYYVHMDSFPLTGNGKVNRKQLPVPTKHQNIKKLKNDIMPENAVQDQVTKMWQEILELDDIGVDDNFFDLGGYSIQATLLLGKIKNMYNVEVPLREIFSTPTIRKIAEIIMNKLHSGKMTAKDMLQINTSIVGAKGKEETSGIVLMRESSDQERNLFLIHDVTGEINGYKQFCESVDSSYNCWGIRADYLTDAGPKYLQMEDVAEEYIQRIKRIQPDGPYLIGGWSMGGVIALEISKLFEQRNEKVLMLSIFDAITPVESSIGKKESFALIDEITLLQKAMPGFEENFMADAINDTNELWKAVINYCSLNDEASRLIRNMVSKLLGSLYYALPEIAETDIKALIHYVNVVRSISNLYYGYMPQTRLRCNIDFFYVNESEYAKDIDRWQAFSEQTVHYHKMNGTHFTMFHNKNAKDLGIKFNEILDRQMDIVR